MRYPLSLILLICFTAHGQYPRFKEIKLKPGSSFYKTNERTIVFPIVVTNNKQVDKQINTELKNEMFSPDDDKQSIEKVLVEHINDYGLINLSYEVTYKLNGILSMHIYAEGCGAHCSSWTTYFNFDLKTGKKITIDDLVIESKTDSFRKIVFADKIKALNSYKSGEIDNVTNNHIDSATYHWVLEQVDSNCINTVEIDNFSLSGLMIEIIDPCEFPHAIRSQEPSYKLEYPLKSISSFLKPKFKRLLLK